MYELSKKKVMPSSSQEVRNHMIEKMMKVIFWYLPSPSIFEMSFSKGES